MNEEGNLDFETEVMYNDLDIDFPFIGLIVPEGRIVGEDDMHQEMIEAMVGHYMETGEVYDF